MEPRFAVRTPWFGGEQPPAGYGLRFERGTIKGFFRSAKFQRTDMTMLDRMRRHRNWLKWSLVLLIVPFALYFLPDFLDDRTSAATASPREVLATIEGREVTAGQFQRRFATQMQAYQQAYGGNMNAELLRQLGIEQQILQQMVDEQAALVEAERHGITVSDEELSAQILSFPAFQEAGQFIGQQQYAQILRSQRPPMTVAEFEENLRRSMAIQKFRTALTDWISLSDAELRKEYVDRNEKVKLQVVALTADKFRDKVNLSDADVASYFEAHKAEYRVGERRKVKFMLIDQEQVRQKLSVTPAEVETYYKDNLQQYQTPEQVRASHILLKTEGKDAAAVQKQAEEILKQVKSGADFAALAKKHSEDDGSKANGGDLDYFGRGRMVPEFENAAFSMQPGQVSDLVKTQYGFHIIKVVDKKPATTRSLDEVRGEITEQLQFQKSQDAVQTQARSADEQIDDPSDLDRVAKTNGYMLQESGLFTREEPVPGLGVAPAVAQQAFQLKDGDVSGAIMSPRGPVFIAVTGKADPYVPKLEEVKDKVREDAIRARATELSRQRAGEIAAALRSASSFAAAAKSQGLEAKDTELLARGTALPDIGVSPEVEKVAFALPVGGVSGPIVTGGGTVIVRVAERDPVTDEEFNQARDSFREQLLTERQGRFYSSWMTKAKQKMSIEINNEVLRRVVGT
jgi:peptidyl-prolyl cis-trans isomerase D